MPGLVDVNPVLFAQAAQGGGGANASPGAALWTFLPYAVVIGLWFYLLLVRPQQQQEKKRRAMLTALKKNDKVLTGAGIFGTVVSIDPDQDRVVVRIDDDKGVKVAFNKASIVRVLEESPEKSKDKDKEKEKAGETA
jgi:preprotein translocase subunit YajC